MGTVGKAQHNTLLGNEGMSTQHRTLSTGVSCIQTDEIKSAEECILLCFRTQTNPTCRAVIELILQLNTVSLHKQGIKLNQEANNVCC